MGISDHVCQRGNIIYTFTMIASERYGDPDDPKKVTEYVNEETLMWDIPTDKRTEGAASITPWLLREKELQAEYDKWKAGLGETALAGTPLETWPAIQSNPAALRNLTLIGIKTVEQLAGVDEGMLASLGQSLRPLRDIAISFTRKDSLEEVTALKDDVARLMAEIEALKAGKAAAETAVATPAVEDDKALLLAMIEAAGGKGDKRKGIETLRAELAELQAAKAA